MFLSGLISKKNLLELVFKPPFKYHYTLLEWYMQYNKNCVCNSLRTAISRARDLVFKTKKTVIIFEVFEEDDGYRSKQCYILDWFGDEVYEQRKDDMDSIHTAYLFSYNLESWGKRKYNKICNFYDENEDIFLSDPDKSLELVDKLKKEIDK